MCLEAEQIWASTRGLAGVLGLGDPYDLPTRADRSLGSWITSGRPWPGSRRILRRQPSLIGTSEQPSSRTSENSRYAKFAHRRFRLAALRREALIRPQPRSQYVSAVLQARVQSLCLEQCYPCKWRRNLGQCCNRCTCDLVPCLVSVFFLFFLFANLRMGSLRFSGVL